MNRLLYPYKMSFLHNSYASVNIFNAIAISQYPYTKLSNTVGCQMFRWKFRWYASYRILFSSLHFSFNIVFRRIMLKNIENKCRKQTNVSNNGRWQVNWFVWWRDEERQATKKNNKNRLIETKDRIWQAGEKKSVIWLEYGTH